MTETSLDAAPAAPPAVARPAYDRMSMLLHWLSALLVLAQFATALLIDQVPPDWSRGLLAGHRSTGVALWLLVAGRLVWRFTGMRAPPLPATLRPWHVRGVRLSEYGLYALLLAQPVTGLLDTLYRGRPFALFGLTVPELLAKNRPYAAYAHTLHLWGAWTLAALVGLHAAAALFHHVVLKDGVLRSMWAGPYRGDGV